LLRSSALCRRFFHAVSATLNAGHFGGSDPRSVAAPVDFASGTSFAYYFLWACRLMPLENRRVGHGATYDNHCDIEEEFNMNRPMRTILIPSLLVAQCAFVFTGSAWAQGRNRGGGGQGGDGRAQAGSGARSGGTVNRDSGRAESRARIESSTPRIESNRSNIGSNRSVDGNRSRREFTVDDRWRDGRHNNDGHHDDGHHHDGDHHDHDRFFLGFGISPWFSYGGPWYGFYGPSYGYYGPWSGSYAYDWPYYYGEPATEVTEGSAYLDPNSEAPRKSAAAAQNRGDVSSPEGADFQRRAERAFRAGQYDEAVRQANHAAVEMPRNGKLFLLLSQSLFAVGDYAAAAGAAHQGMAMSDQADWGAVVKNYTRFYGNASDFTDQLRRLEKFVSEHPKATYARFLLGFQYGFLNYPAEARRELEEAVRLEDRDELAAQLLVQFGGEAPRGIERNRSSNRDDRSGDDREPRGDRDRAPARDQDDTNRPEPKPTDRVSEPPPPPQPERPRQD
jgi:hypothetical protein